MPSIFINPTPLLSKVEGPHSLSERVNIATRSLHTQLNRLILLRLPLALPPRTTNPSKYVSGLLFIAPIYITFESIWQSVLDSPCEEEEAKQSLNGISDARSPTSEQGTNPATSSPYILPRKTCSRLYCLLSDLQLPGLPRAETLRTDIRVLTGTPRYKVQEQLSAVSQHGRLAEFLSHTKNSVDANPHVLLAYAWVLYMALFSGGRHLRAELKKAGGIGLDFWNRELSPVRPYSITQERSRRHESKSTTCDSERIPRLPRSRSRSESAASTMVPGMQFFNFPGSEDGEDIKREFKARYAEAESHLTEAEKEDIVSEAQYIFKFMLDLIADLDLIMQTREEELETERLLDNSRPLVASRDSVAVTHERLSRRRTSDTKIMELPRKASYLDVFVNQPIAKLTQFRGAVATWDLVMKPLGRRFSTDGPSPQVSFSSESEKDGQTSPSFTTEHYLVMLVVMVSVSTVLLAYYYASS
ncbi:heme oxygenase-like protein [Mollisia scopiformis]|uniref:Heme oxygenase-like protein n=1 Tax=Mollisia scopiformis TaxID=149040 RepID=A0A194XQ83_MOLSC|nr:heme oxygenase-like protein [Mollisia scopiformis]KUJ22214.1 heme oxygenase-like protein [Mollisia scopiformis]